MKKSIIFILIVAVVTMIVYGVRYVKTPVTTESIYLTKYEETVKGNAFIVKKETVNTAPAGGTLYNYAVDGNRVGNRRRIASVYNGSVNTDILQELNNIDKKIELMTIEQSTQQIETSDSMSAESRISERKNGILNSIYSGDISAIATYKEEIKNIRNGTDGGDDTNEMSELEQKRASLESQIGKSKSDIFSASAGIFIANVDGYEHTLTPESIADFTVADFNALPVPEKAAAKETVSAGEEVSKIVDNHVWYAMIKIKSSELAEEYTVGKKVKIRFDAIPSSEVSAVIYNISEDDNGEKLLTVKCEKYLDGIFAIRYTTAEVVLKNYTGYKVPVYAIRVRDGQKGIEVQKGIGTIFKPCEVLYTDENEDFVIINSTENSENPIENSDLVYIGEK